MSWDLGTMGRRWLICQDEWRAVSACHPPDDEDIGGVGGDAEKCRRGSSCWQVVSHSALFSVQKPLLFPFYTVFILDLYVHCMSNIQMVCKTCLKWPWRVMIVTWWSQVKSNFCFRQRSDLYIMPLSCPLSCQPPILVICTTSSMWPWCVMMVICQ